MPQAEVRAAIAAYLLALEVDGVVAVFKEFPSSFYDAQWALTDETQWAAMLAVHIDSFDESRLSLPAAGSSAGGPVGQKERVYQTSILVSSQYVLESWAAPGTDEAAYIDHIDFLIDTIIGGIHADPTLGTDGSPVFEAGQADQGISVTQDLPQLDAEGSRVYAMTRIAFVLREIINA